MRHSKRPRSQSGTSMVELAIGAMVMIVVALFALDIGAAMACYGVNDRACRDAARAAAQGSTQTEAQNLATQIVKTYSSSANLMGSPQVVSVVYTDFNGTPPDGTSPFVTVTTKTTARPIAPISIFGKDVISASFPLQKRYTFPIVKLKVKSNGP